MLLSDADVVLIKLFDVLVSFVLCQSITPGKNNELLPQLIDHHIETAATAGGVRDAS